MRRKLAGFIHRVVYATLFGMAGWYSCVFPPGFPWQEPVQEILCYVLTFPPAVVGQMTYPLSSMDLFFSRIPWCHHCSAQEVLWYHLRFAVPVYVMLFYLPAFVVLVARRDRQLFTRMMIGLMIYTVMSAVFFLATNGTDRGNDIRVVAMWFVVLAAAAAFAWSKLDRTHRVLGVVGVVLLGAWAIPFELTFIAPKMDGVQISDYIAYVFVLLAAVTLLLGTTRAIEYALERMRERRTASA